MEEPKQDGNFLLQEQSEDEGLVVQCLYSHYREQKLTFPIIIALDCGAALSSPRPLFVTWIRSYPPPSTTSLRIPSTAYML